MNEEITTTENDPFDFSTVPEEVMEFLYSPEYKIAIQKLVGELKLNEEQRVILSGTIIGLVTNTTSNTEAQNTFAGMTTTPEAYSNLKKQIEEIFIIPAYKNVIKSLEESEKEEVLDKEVAALDVIEVADIAEVASAPSPSDMLARLNQTLTQPTTFASSKRLLPIVLVSPQPSSDTSTTLTTSAPSIDLYRELPKE